MLQKLPLPVSCEKLLCSLFPRLFHRLGNFAGVVVATTATAANCSSLCRRLDGLLLQLLGHRLLDVHWSVGQLFAAAHANDTATEAAGGEGEGELADVAEADQQADAAQLAEEENGHQRKGQWFVG